MNSRDHNAILGPHPVIDWFYFANGSSGHGLQQSPAVGRALGELLVFGEYRTIDLTRFGFDRLAGGPFLCWKRTSYEGPGSEPQHPSPGKGARASHPGKDA